MNVSALMSYILYLTCFDFSREIVCMKSAEWFWQSLILWVCGRSSFPVSQESVWLTWLSEWLQNSRGPGQEYTLGCFADSPPLVSAGYMLSSFSQLKYWPQCWSQEYNSFCWLIFFVSLWFFSLPYVSQTKSKTFIPADEFSESSWFILKLICSCSQGKLHFWSLLYNYIFPHLPPLLCEYSF